MYSKKFENVSRLLHSYIEKDELIGASVSVIRANKEIYRENIGYANTEKNIPICDNTIFRLFSMTMPVTSVAMMMLYEKGMFDLYDPVSKFIPAYKSQKVVTPYGFVNSEREVTIKDLFNMTVGIPYPDLNTVAGIEINKIFSKIASDTEKGSPWSLQKSAEAFAYAPMAFHPGESWMYGLSADIIGAIIEILTQKQLSVFFKEEIFEPLNMDNTDFYINKQNKERLAQVYCLDKDDKFTVFNEKRVSSNNFLSTPVFESAGFGLISTMDDYIKFTSMLLNSGIFNCQKILSRKSIELMTCNHLNCNQMKTYNWRKLRGYGYGMLLRTMINLADTGCLGSVGEFGWDSWTGSWFCVDPKEKLSIVYMMQQVDKTSNKFVPKLKNTIYSMLE